MYLRFFKPGLDFLGASFLILILSPLLLLVSILIFIFMGFPVFFTQERLGQNDAVFKIYKFRTMRNLNSNASNDEQDRLTLIGKFLRRFSIDELPQLFNVLKGNMSLVGPRPFLPEYLPYYTEEERRRHLARPGLTGLAQIKGRRNLSWDDRLKLDVFYIDNSSFLFDIKLIFMTPLAIFFSKDASLGNFSFEKLSDARSVK